MRIYLASRYGRREEMLSTATLLRSYGHDVQADWISGKHDDTPDVECALIDFEQVRASDVVVSFTEVPGDVTGRGRGGRHVEFGIGLALGKRCVVMGHRENVFHFLPSVEFYEDLRSLIAALAVPR